MFKQFKIEDYTVLDVEANGLDDATIVHLVVLREVINSHVVKTVYRDLSSDQDSLNALRDHIARCKVVAGHNIIGYDLRILDSLLDIKIECPVLDTLVLSRLLNYNIEGGHSLETWGVRLGITKEGTGIVDWSIRTAEMESRCLSDVEINFAIVQRYMRILQDDQWQDALETEHFVARQCRRMHSTGFPFDRVGAESLREHLDGRLTRLDAAIEVGFPPKAVAIREITPRRTKAGTLNATDFRWVGSKDLSAFDGGPFTVFEYVPFNPGSPRQIIERLNEFGWKPTEKTKGHVEALRARPQNKEKLREFARVGWKVSEENLKTLPPTAPSAAFKLAERIAIASRVSDLSEWLALCDETKASGPAIYGSFQSIGAWTHRLSHQKPNTANIPQSKPSKKDTPFVAELQVLNGEMRKLFRARPGYRLIGTDADGIQMRIFAHLCGDQSLIDSLVKGRKEDGTDAHSLNKSLLGSVCGSRDVAKTFIYAFLLGAGAGKIAEILGCSAREAKDAVDRFIGQLSGLTELKHGRIPADATRGYFVGLDGRKVVCDSKHLMMSGYLQNGEKVLMAKAMQRWVSILDGDGIDYLIHNWVHDEWQTGSPDDDEVCAHIQRTQCDALVWAGAQLGLSLPTPGESKWGYNWKATH